MSSSPQRHRTKQDSRLPQVTREDATRRAATEYARVVALLETLGPEQWRRPTECPGWDVRAMAGHMLGMVQMVASVPEMVRQQVGAGRRAKRDGVVLVDALTALQVDKNASLAPEGLIAEMRRLAPRAVRGRSRAPGLLRRQTIPDGDEWWTLGYLFDVILTRDPFLHRVDLTRATGAEMVLSPEHEGAIVADVVAEWADRHGAAYDLELTGPAGGRWQRGEGERLTLDALDFCRALSGRAPAEGLLRTQVPF
ncbi:maleylpyruvate isomerase family mycothiol-dependent enzyme [Nocardioides sp. HDW12B]|uniref:maleylpyruvate isomerase family mycothiol-dependent enzyme n=1 Tax=Nocardioides sp. HDW12B TaxID=2714939 RepID=UPI00140C6BB3|nr:maleylpyruvate isomerase family mycothiol-dependent enzyme [Nocardioides sp. HDW12B]QIK66507.1 maleylpyruvate isomerase family mycothiol-dependent enzyme [Nocardioides sp. HDW12B]